MPTTTERLLARIRELQDELEPNSPPPAAFRYSIENGRVVFEAEARASATANCGVRLTGFLRRTGRWW